MEKGEKKDNRLALKDNTIFSVRVNGRSTSFSIKNRIISFYCAVTETECTNCLKEFTEIALDLTKDWHGDTAKGLSDYIVGRLLEGLLRKKEMKQYMKIINKLNTGKLR